MKRGLAI